MTLELQRIGIFDPCPVCDEGELEPFEPSTRLWGGQKGYACNKCGRVIVDQEFKICPESRGAENVC